MIAAATIAALISAGVGIARRVSRRRRRNKEARAEVLALEAVDLARASGGDVDVKRDGKAWLAALSPDLDHGLQVEGGRARRLPLTNGLALLASTDYLRAIAAHDAGQWQTPTARVTLSPPTFEPQADMFIAVEVPTRQGAIVVGLDGEPLTIARDLTITNVSTPEELLNR